MDLQDHRNDAGESRPGYICSSLIGVSEVWQCQAIIVLYSGIVPGFCKSIQYYYSLMNDACNMGGSLKIIHHLRFLIWN